MSLLQPVPEHERELLDALVDDAVDRLLALELLDEADSDAAWRALRPTLDGAYTGSATTASCSAWAGGVLRQRLHGRRARRVGGQGRA